LKRPSGSQPRLTPSAKISVPPRDSLYADEFDALVRELVPKVRALLPGLSDVEVLRAAARMAEYRLSDERTLMDVDFLSGG
jgi:hypothetical protein